jgi:hypothetical protein
MQDHRVHRESKDQQERWVHKDLLELRDQLDLREPPVTKEKMVLQDLKEQSDLRDL